MANISLNGVVFSGTPAAPATPFKPTKIDGGPRKIGREIEAADGTPYWMQRAQKRRWTISWAMAHEATRAALEAIFLLATTFPYVDQRGTSYTVQCHAEDYTETTAFTDAANTIYYQIDLTLRQA